MEASTPRAPPQGRTTHGDPGVEYGGRCDYEKIFSRMTARVRMVSASAGGKDVDKDCTV